VPLAEAGPVRPQPAHEVNEQLQRTLARIPELSERAREGYRATRLASFTNATYRLDVGGECFALRLPGPGTERYIDRAREARNAAVAAAAGVAPVLVWFDRTDGAMLTRWVAGCTTTPQSLRQRDVGRRAALTLRRLHRLRARFRGRFDVFAAMADYEAMLAVASVSLPAAYAELAGSVRLIEQALAERPAKLVPCHNDPYPGNLVDTGATVCLVDWEYAAMGDPMWDLADLSVESGYTSADDEALLETYYGGRVPAASSHRFGLLQVMSDVAWGVWSYVQLLSADPAVDYAEYGLARFAAAHQRLSTLSPRRLATVTAT